MDGSPYDFSFSGLKTAVLNTLHHAEQVGETLNKADLCASFRDRVVGLLCDHTLAAAAEYGVSTVVLAGGVSANRELRRRMTSRCEDLGYRLYMPPLSLCGDNAAMIGAQGYFEYCAGNVAGANLNAVATMPVDSPVW